MRRNKKYSLIIFITFWHIGKWRLSKSCNSAFIKIHINHSNVLKYIDLWFCDGDLWCSGVARRIKGMLVDLEPFFLPPFLRPSIHPSIYTSLRAPAAYPSVHSSIQTRLFIHPSIHPKSACPCLSPSIQTNLSTHPNPNFRPSIQDGFFCGIKINFTETLILDKITCRYCRQQCVRIQRTPDWALKRSRYEDALNTFHFPVHLNDISWTKI